MMDNSKENTRMIEELQILEQNLHNFLAQKQTSQVELREVENALSEIEKTIDDVYKILSGIMIKADKDDLKKELKERKRLLEMRIESIEKQENIIDGRIDKIREKITGTAKK